MPKDQNYKSPAQGWREFWHGIYRPQLDAGNRANSPAEPPLVTGGLQFQQGYLFQDDNLSDMKENFTGGDHVLVGMGYSGLTGGGSTSNVPDFPYHAGEVGTAEAGTGDVTFNSDDYE